MSSIFDLLRTASARRARGAVILSAVLALTLTACGQGALSSNQTPTAGATKQKPTPTATPQPGTAFRYAFARGDEIWIAQPGKDPQQVSQLPSDGLNITDLAWSHDGKHLAFERSGAGNPVDYVMDTTTGSVVALNVPSTAASATFGWSSDNKTVIVAKQLPGSITQIWQEDITNNTSNQATQISGVSQVEVRGQSVYYALLDSTANQIMLHRYDLNVKSEGTPVAITPVGASTLNVNWDVSPDGSHVVMGFNLPTADATWANGFWYISTSDNTDRQQIFTELTLSSFTASDPITLSFSPDGQTVVLDTNKGAGPASEGVDASSFQQYTPHVGITSQTGISWAPNGASFALTSGGTSAQATIFMLGSSASGTTLVSNASLLQWAPQS
jgi:Tol biopolymer transport system component